MTIADQITIAKRELVPILARSSFDTVVKSLSNYQRNQWAKAGYPGLQKKDKKGPARFIAPPQLLHRFEFFEDQKRSKIRKRLLVGLR